MREGSFVRPRVAVSAAAIAGLIALLVFAGSGGAADARSASGAATAKAQKVTRIDVSTRAAVVHYLRSINVSAKGVVIQRGLRNYAGAHCPGKGWTCAGTRHTVVQIAKRDGQNRFACARANCVVAQLASVSYGVHSAGRALASTTPPTTNTASCIKTTGVTQTCTINQPSGAFVLNKAVVWMDTGKLTGLTQSASYSASITQGPASAGSSSNWNLACVHQSVSITGSTTSNGNVTVTNDSHQLVTINQNSGNGNNTVQGAVNPSKGVYGCNSDSNQPLTQDESLKSIVTANGSITQKQNTLPSTTSCVPPSGPTFSGCANVVVDIEQNQGTGFKGVASGLNNAAFTQTTQQVAVANAVTGKTVTQQQGANVPNPPYSGIVGTLNQDSSNTSTATVVQDETQCEDATNTKNSSPPLTDCSHTADAPSGITLNQTQYGPHKGYGKSEQTGNTAAAPNSFTLNQISHQYTDSGPTVHVVQSNTIQADCLVVGGNCQASQQATLNGQDTIDVQSGTNTNVNSTIDCPNGHPSCTKTLSAPKITQQPDNPSPYGSGKRFEFQNADPTVTFLCSLDGAAYGSCDNVTNPTITTPPYPPTTGYENTSGLASGKHTFSVETQDSANPSANPPATATIQWVITPPDPTITSGPGTGSGSQTTSTAANFVFADADSTAKFVCKLDDAASYTACPSTVSHGPHVLDVKATDSTGTYESTGNAEYTWEVIPYLTFETSGTGSSAGWSDTAGSSPITLVVGTDPGSYGQFTIHDRSDLTVSDLALKEPTFTTDVYDGAPRYEIDLDNGDYLFGYPPQAGFGSNSWDINCGGTNINCVPKAFVTWAEVQNDEGAATITDVLIEADSNPGDTYSVSDFQFDGYHPSHVAP